MGRFMRKFKIFFLVSAAFAIFNIFNCGIINNSHALAKQENIANRTDENGEKVKLQNGKDIPQNICADVTIKNNDIDFVSIISALTALIAVIVGPYTSFKVLERQNKHNTNQVFCSDFIKEISKFIGNTKHYLEKKEKNLLKEVDAETIRIEINEIYFRLAILINSKIKNKELIDSCKELLDIINDGSQDYASKISRSNNIISIITEKSTSYLNLNIKYDA